MNKIRKTALIVAPIAVATIIVALILQNGILQNQANAENALSKFRIVNVTSLSSTAVLVRIENLTDFEECVTLFQGIDAVVFRKVQTGRILYFFPYQGVLITYEETEDMIPMGP